MTSFLYIAFGVMLFTAAAVVATLLREKRRARQMREVGVRLGFSDTAIGRDLLAEGLGELPLFVLSAVPGKSEIRNVLRKHGTKADMFLCDYHYWSGNPGKNRSDHDQTIACFELPGPVLPAFTLQQRPSGLEREVVRVGLGMAGLPARMASSRLRGALDIMMKSIDDEGIQFEPYPDFTQRYWLRSQENADEIRPLFTEELIRFLETQSRPLCIESRGRWLAIYRKDVKVKPEEIYQFGPEAERVLGMLLKAREATA